MRKQKIPFIVHQLSGVRFMELVVQEAAQQSIIPEDTVLNAEVLSVQQVTKPWEDENGNSVVKISFEFRITDDRYSGWKIWGETPTTFSNTPFCKLYNWVLELLGQERLEAGFKLDTDLLVGLPIRVVVANTKPKDASKPPRAYVSDVIRVSAVSNDAVAANEPF